MVACDVMAVMLVDVNKRFLISFFCYTLQRGRHVFVFTWLLRMIATQELVYEIVLDTNYTLEPRLRMFFHVLYYVICQSMVSTDY
jgi:hypothetical protein